MKKECLDDCIAKSGRVSDGAISRSIEQHLNDEYRTALAQYLVAGPGR